MTWSAPVSIIPGMAHPILLDCPTSSFCMAVNTAGHYAIWDGTRWHASGKVGLPAEAPVWGPPYPVTQLSCPAAGFCVAGDYESVAVFAGGAWQPSTTLPYQNGAVTFGLSCATTTFCVVFNNHGFAWTFDGVSWVGPAVMAPEADGPGYPVEDAISCPTTTFCMSVGTGGATFTLDGTQWNAHEDPGSESVYAIAVDCTGAAFCATLDSPQGTQTFDGTTWTNSGQRWAQPMTALSCADPTFCVTVGDSNKIDIWDGAGWTGQYAIHGLPVVVSCPTPTFCMSVDDRGGPLIGRR